MDRPPPAPAASLRALRSYQVEEGNFHVPSGPPGSATAALGPTIFTSVLEGRFWAMGLFTK